MVWTRDFFWYGLLLILIVDCCFKGDFCLLEARGRLVVGMRASMGLDPLVLVVVIVGLAGGLGGIILATDGTTVL